MSDPHPPAGPPPRGMLRIGRIGSTDVLVSNSWFLIAGLIAVVMAPRVDQIQPGLGPWKYVVGVAFAIALYLAILLHEASHALMAQRFGFKVPFITLHFLGGATTIAGESRRPRQEFWIAVVGPLTSLAVGAAALGLWFITPDGLLLLVVEGLAGANLLIGVLNLVPGLPLDGGRVLKAGVWALTGKVESGTIAAAWGGRATALAVVVWAVLVGRSGDVVNALLLGIVALFLWTASSQALRTSRITRRIMGLTVRDLARRAIAVPDDLPLAEAVRRAKDAEAGGIVTVSSTGAPIGVVDERAMLAVPEERRPWVAVSTVTRSLDAHGTLPISVTGEGLLQALRTRPSSEYLLVGEDGSLYGVLAAADVVRAVGRG